MRLKKRLGAEEFEAMRPLLDMPPARLAVARAVLVDGHTLQFVGNHYGCSRQAVAKTVDIAWKVSNQYRASQQIAANNHPTLLPGWEQVTLVAPTYLISEFRRAIAEAIAALADPAPGAPFTMGKTETSGCLPGRLSNDDTDDSRASPITKTTGEAT